MVAITGQVSRPAIGTDAFQECDTVGITRSVTKHNELVMDPNDIPMIVRQAFHIATTGRPGPVLHRRAEGRSPGRHGLDWPTRRGRGARTAGLHASDQGRPQADREAAEPDRREPPAGDLRRGRDPEGPGRRDPAHPGRADRHPRGHHADGPWRLPRRPSALPRHAGHARQLHRHHRHAERRSAHRPREPFRRPGDRQAGRLRARRQDHPRRHRPGRAGQGAPARRRHRRRLPARHRSNWCTALRERQRRQPPIAAPGRARSRAGRRSSPCTTTRRWRATS